MDREALAATVVDAAYHIHRDIGPGLLESVYEVILAEELKSRGLQVERQVVIPIRYRDLDIAEAFRADLLVEGTLLAELKSVERLAPIHGKQVLTYLRLLDLPLGLLINFGAETIKEGIRRIANGRLDR